MAFDSAVSVNETAPVGLASGIGDQLRQARKSRRLSQRALAAAADVDLATVKGLERGKGTVGPLCSVLNALDHRFAHQPPDAVLGPWIATVRKAAGYSQARLAVVTGLSKPTIIQIEHGRGNLQSLLQVMRVLRMETNITPSADALLGVQMFLGDCLEILPSLADHAVHAIITDLPYSLTNLDWDRSIPLGTLWEQFRRLLTPTGVVVLTAAQPFTSELVMSNPEWFKSALVWEKSRVTGFLQAKQRHLKKHEDILVFSPGTVVSGNRRQTARNMTYNPQGLAKIKEHSRSLGSGPNSNTADTGAINTLSAIYRPCYVQPNRKLDGDPVTFDGKPLTGGECGTTHTNYPTSVLRFASVAKPIHPTQKPLDLMRYLVRTFSNEGETILDCCFGSGTTGVAAVLEGRKFIGVEQDEAYFKMGMNRLIQTATDLPPNNKLSSEVASGGTSDGLRPVVGK